MSASFSPLATRVARHRGFSDEIEGSCDADLLALVSKSDLLQRGKAVLELPRSGGRVFAKLLPLTPLELQPESRHSTANLFGLPAHYHYRIGSCGLGTWRELEVHRAANEWVLSGPEASFPLLHGWRVLPLASPLDPDLSDVDRWGKDPAIQRRVEAISAATASALLFVEHFPETLGQRLGARLTKGASLSLVEETEARLRKLLSFTRSQGLLHMDVHFENLLMNGDELLLTDFGLAISQTFRLRAEEKAFFERHRTFDLCTALTSNVHAATLPYESSSDDWRLPLRTLLSGGESSLDEAPADLRRYLTKRGPVALAIGDFYRRLVADLATEYPEASLQALLDRP